MAVAEYRTGETNLNVISVSYPSFNPDEAVQAFHDLGGSRLLPMYYGTFDLSDEPFGEPFRRMNGLESSVQGGLCLAIPGEIIQV